MAQITERFAIPDEELRFSYARSGGPGGQHVNKVATKAILHWNVRANASIPQAVRDRLINSERNRVTAEGDLVLSSQKTRDQDRNRQDCLEKLGQLLAAASFVPKARKATKPTKGSQRRRVEAKRRHSAVKEGRRSPPGD